MQNEAILVNARQTFNRAQQLLKTGHRRKKRFDMAQASLTEADARLNSLQTKLARRAVFSPARGVYSAGLFPSGGSGCGRPAGRVAPARPRNLGKPLLCSAGRATGDKGRGRGDGEM